MRDKLTVLHKSNGLEILEELEDRLLIGLISEQEFIKELENIIGKWQVRKIMRIPVDDNTIKYHLKPLNKSELNTVKQLNIKLGTNKTPSVIREEINKKENQLYEKLWIFWEAIEHRHWDIDGQCRPFCTCRIRSIVPTLSTLKCPNCGTENKEGTKHCDQCGYKLLESSKALLKQSSPLSPEDCGKVITKHYPDSEWKKPQQKGKRRDRFLVIGPRDRPMFSVADKTPKKMKKIMRPKQPSQP